MNIATRIRILSGICVLILCFVLLPANISCQGYPASSQKAITITYDFPEPLVEETSEIPPPKGALPAAEGCVSVTMEDLPKWSEPGLPVLPFKTANILLPYGFDVERITVICGNKVALPGSYMVEPGQKAVPLSYEGSVNVTPPDREVYDSSAPFPGKLYSDDMIQTKAGCRILLVNLHPVEYIPEPGQLYYYENLTVEVTLRAAATAQGGWRSVKHLAQDEDVVREMVDNPDAIKSYRAAPSSFETLSLLDPADYEYVIITNEALEATPGPNNFQALRDEKISRGITATIVTTEWIYANYSGTRPDGGVDNQTKIRNFIIDANGNWGTKYVLLGGDGDGADVGGESGDDIIPARGFAADGDSDIAADMYYACLDGTFDYNANGIYGEPNDGPGGGEVDLFAEVYVGRAPVDSQAEVQNFVSKTLAYQSMPVTDENLRKVWMVGEYLGFGGVADWGGNYKDEIKDGSSAHGYTTVGFEDSAYAPGFDVSTLYDRDYPGHDWPASEIINIINDNVHLINHLGHANVGYVMKMVNSDVDNLTNDELYFIGYSQGCYSGSFDNRDDSGYYTDYDCIAEHLTTQPHGAVAFIANSRYGWGAGGSTDGPSQHYDREFWDAVFGEDILNIGIANQDSKEDNAGRVGDEIERWCYYEINLFGDPELALKLYEGVTYDSHEIDDSAGGDNDGYPEPGESIDMPVTLRNTSTNTTFSDVSATLTATTYASTTIFSDDFEGSWPGDWIYVDDVDSRSGKDYWGQSNYRAYSGNFSAYCAEVSDVPGQSYDNYMEAFMVRDVDLSAYDSATLSYKYWLDCEYSYDHFDVVYFDGLWHSVQSHTGNSSGWVSDSVEVPLTATQVGFLFYSDYSVTYEGAYIDDVVLTGHSCVTDPYIDISDASEDYGNIPPGDVATSLDAYDFTIDQACSDGHIVRFNLDITASNGGPWADSFDVRIGSRGVAVLGDYESQLTNLLIDNDIWAEERDWDIIDDIGDYYAVVVNRPSDPGKDTFLEFLQAASDNQVRVIFTSSWPLSNPDGISLLQQYLGDPVGQGHAYGNGDVYYQVKQTHQLFEGWEEGDNITIINGGDCDHAWFWGYSGYTIADSGSEYHGIQGDAVALGVYGESLHILLAGLAPQSYTNVSHWTEDAKTIFIRAVTMPFDELVVVTTGLPRGVVGEEYHATLNAYGGTRPYTWAIIDSALPDGLGLDGETGIISGTPTETGTFNFTVELTDADEATATRRLSVSVIELNEFITDPVGDQFYGYGPDIVGADFQTDETTIYFRVRTAEPLDPNDTVNEVFLDLDLDNATGYMSDYPYEPTNDIGADAVAFIYPTGISGTMGEGWSLPIQRSNDERQLDTEPTQVLSGTLRGELYLWDPDYKGFYYVGGFPVLTDTNYFWFAIPLGMLGDDGVMNVVDVIGDSGEPTDVAPNEGHGITGEGPDLAIADKWEEWINENEGTYTVHYVVKNQGNVIAPANHETALTVDGLLLETKSVPVALEPGEEYSDSFSTIVTISRPTDEITVCADFYDVVDELSEENNCLTNTLWIEPAWTEFITDPVGDQFDGYGPDIVGADFQTDETTVYFRVRTAEPIDSSYTFNEMWLDLDQNASTGYVSDYTDEPTNDIGADAVAFIYPAYGYGMTEGKWSLPLQITSGERQLESEPAQALLSGLMGELYLWDPDYEDFYYVGSFPVLNGTSDFWLAIPLDMLDDDGVMSVVDVIGDFFFGGTDVAPNQYHGYTGRSQGMGCFIATAAYGTPMAEEIQILREFRDEYLLTNPVGRAFVDFYYRVSPPIAEFITEHPSLKPIVRAALVPAVAMSTVAVNTTPAEKAAIIGLLVLVSVALAVWATRRRGGGPEYT
ncbi:MAG: C25 family cysteine peptidase [Dehalococcoidia bacterium]